MSYHHQNSPASLLYYSYVNTFQVKYFYQLLNVLVIHVKTV